MVNHNRRFPLMSQYFPRRHHVITGLAAGEKREMFCRDPWIIATVDHGRVGAC